MREAVIVDAIRTPIGRRGGVLSGINPVDLLAHVLTQLVARSRLEPEKVDDVIVGCVHQTGEQGLNIARNAWLSAGLPESVPGTTVDRQCGSSLQALHFAAQGVLAGAYDIAIAAGVESMSRVPMGVTLLNGPGTPMTENLRNRYQWDRPWFDQAYGADKIAQRWELSRQDLDQWSYQSHIRASQAQQQGKYQNEIVPFTVNGQTISQDEGIRPNPSLEKMATLPVAFPGLQSITAANSSQISDGASAVLVTTPEVAKQLGLTPRARFVSFAVVGVDPVTMLTGPIPATQKVLKKAGLSISDMGLYEVNEAFAPVVLAWLRDIQGDPSRLNVHGGAIALGHPLGATGTRITATLLNALEDRKERYGLMAICEGGGMANATIIERL